MWWWGGGCASHLLGAPCQPEQRLGPGGKGNTHVLIKHPVPLSPLRMLPLEGGGFQASISAIIPPPLGGHSGWRGSESGAAGNGAESASLLSQAAAASAQLRVRLSRDLGNADDGILLVSPELKITHRFTEGPTRTDTGGAPTGHGSGPRASGD